MKENGIEKLIELLEAFEKENVEKLKSDVWENDTISPRVWSKSDMTIYNKLQVISKEFGFIKWLVDNDKIDFDKIQIGFQLTLGYGKYDSLLMILSISDTPIEDLISYFKK